MTNIPLLVGILISIITAIMLIPVVIQLIDSLNQAQVQPGIITDTGQIAQDITSWTVYFNWVMGIMIFCLVCYWIYRKFIRRENSSGEKEKRTKAKLSIFGVKIK